MGSCSSKAFLRHEELDFISVPASSSAVAMVNTDPHREMQALQEDEKLYFDSLPAKLAWAVAIVNTDPHREMQEYWVPEQYSTAHSSASCYHSARIQEMLDRRDRFRSEVEFEIESSIMHHSEVDSATCQTEHSGESNREYFELLKCRQYVREGGEIIVKQRTGDDEKGLRARSLFVEWDGLVVGEKIAEGGQAEIYAATSYGIPLVVKVFKAGSVLQELEKQWPPALLKWYRRDGDPDLPGSIAGATLLRDERLLNRFAFVMWRRWGDLRKLIDHRMMQCYNYNRCAPFSPQVALWLMYRIAEDMNDLHKNHPPIYLKAANVLVHGTTREGHAFSRPDGRYVIGVADYGCSVGVVGTGFWRAPEILQQLKDKVFLSDLKFTDKCDVYSYGMTCYELVTGRLPCEGHPVSKYDMVLNGIRPELPVDLDPLFKQIIISCWHAITSERPSFRYILRELSVYL